jgi:hypothetical protein
MMTYRQKPADSVDYEFCDELRTSTLTTEATPRTPRSHAERAKWDELPHVFEVPCHEQLDRGARETELKDAEQPASKRDERGRNRRGTH